MLTFLRSSPVLVIISSMSVPIGNHFHARVRRAKSGKITSFKGMPIFRLLFRGDPLIQRLEILSRNTKNCRLSQVENPKSLLHLVLEWYRNVTDRRTDRQTYGHQDRITVANTRKNRPCRYKKKSKVGEMEAPSADMVHATVR